MRLMKKQNKDVLNLRNIYPYVIIIVLNVIGGMYIGIINILILQRELDIIE